MSSPAPTFPPSPSASYYLSCCRQRKGKWLCPQWHLQNSQLNQCWSFPSLLCCSFLRQQKSPINPPSHPEIPLIFQKAFGTLTASKCTCYVPLSHPRSPKQSHCQGCQSLHLSPGQQEYLWQQMGRARSPSALCRLITGEIGLQQH